MRLLREKPFQSNDRPTVAQRKGLAYERKVQRFFEEKYGLSYFPSLWFIYGTDECAKYCQLDGLLLDEYRRLATIVEIKLSHTATAYWQMQNLYVPVLRTWLRQHSWKIATLEVVKWYDPSVQCPVPPRLRSSLDGVVPGEFSVHILQLA